MSSELIKALQDDVETLEKKVRVIEVEKEKWETKEKKLVESLKVMQDNYERLAEESKGLHGQMDISVTGFDEFEGFSASGRES
jgi:SMC interacting uncharacterized protein involved in chromosome segregation